MSEPDAAGFGRPEWEPTKEQRAYVEAMSGLGIDQDSIATILDIDPKTLRKHCRRELDAGKAKVIAKVAGALVKAATDPTVKGHVSAQIFFLKTQAKWTERIEVGGLGGGPILTEHRSDADRARALALLIARAKASGEDPPEE